MPAAWYSSGDAVRCQLNDEDVVASGAHLWACWRSSAWWACGTDAWPSCTAILTAVRWFADAAHGRQNAAGRKRGISTQGEREKHRRSNSATLLSSSKPRLGPTSLLIWLAPRAMLLCAPSVPRPLANAMSIENGGSKFTCIAPPPHFCRNAASSCPGAVKLHSCAP